MVLHSLAMALTTPRPAVLRAGGSCLGLWLACAAGPAWAQMGDFRYHFRHPDYVRSHRVESVQVKYKDLREYAGRNKVDRRWHFAERFDFNPDGTIQRYSSGRKDGKPDTPFYSDSKETTTLDSQGRKQRKTFVAAGKVVFEDEYQYDPTGRLLRVMRTEPGQPAPILLQTYRYNAQGQEVEQHSFPSKFSYPFPGQTIKSYAPEGYLAASAFRSEPFDLLDSTYYDAKGQVTEEVRYQMLGRPLHQTSRLRKEYDAAGRVTRTQYGAAIQTWTYNPAGDVSAGLKSDDGNGTNHFIKYVCVFDRHGVPTEEKEYSADFIESPTQISPQHLVALRKWKTKYR
jgi:hypothetical protein